ncbi:MAG: J domain-containing protein [Terracidiphilus sp.]
MTEEGTTLCPRCEALHVLGLGMEALESEIRSANRLLTKAWQPENFQDDPKLKESAEDKLKDIQTAFDFLTLTSTDRGHAGRPVYLASKLAYAPPLPGAKPAAQVARAGSVPSPSAQIPIAAASFAAAPDEAPPRGLWPKIKVQLMLIAAALVILRIGYVWIVFSAHTAPGGPVAANNGSSQGVATPASQLPEEKILGAVMQAFKKPDQSNSVPATSPQTGQHAPSNTKSQQPEKANAATHPAQPATVKLKPYLTVGSTRDEVLAQQGTPTASTEDKLVYGTSELYLKDGRVIGWRIDPFSSPIRVKLWPQSPVDPDLEFFTVNSTKDEVLVVQGTPTEFSEDTFKYGDSVVYFNRNRVVNWKNDPGSVPLRVR